MQHIKKINDAYFYNETGSGRSEIKYKKIANYLHHANLKPDDLRFVVLEVIPYQEYDEISKREEDKFIRETGAGERGFNSVNA